MNATELAAHINGLVVRIERELGRLSSAVGDDRKDAPQKLQAAMGVKAEVEVDVAALAGVARNLLAVIVEAQAKKPELAQELAP